MSMLDTNVRVGCLVLPLVNQSEKLVVYPRLGVGKFIDGFIDIWSFSVTYSFVRSPAVIIDSLARMMQGGSDLWYVALTLDGVRLIHEREWEHDHSLC